METKPIEAEVVEAQEPQTDAPETALATQAPMPPTMLTDTKQLNTLVKVAKFYAESSLVPDKFRGKPADAFVACELANRMGISPLIVMQQLYVVKGKPGWSGQACIAIIDGTRKFTPLDFVYVGKPGERSYGCYAKAIRKADGKEVKGTTITWGMVKDEGWDSNPKWTSMTDQMFAYRAAEFFAKVHCPAALMGFASVDEIEDVAYAKGEDPAIPEPTAKKKITIKKENNDA